MSRRTRSGGPRAAGGFIARGSSSRGNFPGHRLDELLAASVNDDIAGVLSGASRSGRGTFRGRGFDVAENNDFGGIRRGAGRGFRGNVRGRGRGFSDNSNAVDEINAVHSRPTGSDRGELRRGGFRSGAGHSRGGGVIRRKRNFVVIVMNPDVVDDEMNDFVLGVTYGLKQKHPEELATLGENETVRYEDINDAVVFLLECKRKPPADIPEFCLFIMEKDALDRKEKEESLSETDVPYIFVDDFHESTISTVVEEIYEIKRNSVFKPFSEPPKSTHPMGEKTIKELALDETVPDLDVLLKLTSDGSFYSRLNEERRHGPADLTVPILKLINRASRCNIHHCRESLNELLEQVVGSRFWRSTVLDELDRLMFINNENQLRQRQYNVRSLLGDVTSILIEILRALPSRAADATRVASVLTGILRSEAVKANPVIFDDNMQAMEKSLNTLIEDILVRKDETAKTAAANPADRQIDEQPPPNSFRDLDIFPMDDEILTMEKPYLRKNVVSGCYESTEHYLDVQYRLLREDYIHPLREGINTFLQQQANPGGERKRVDVKMYEHVRFSNAKNTKRYGQMTYMLTFDDSKLKRVRWEISKRFLYGSLLCLSSDNFKTMVYATVFDRAVEDLKKGQLHVVINKGVPSFIVEYRMAESAAYFEAYRHVLSALLAIRDERDMPFVKYFVECNPEIEPPLYLRIVGDVFDMACLITDEEFKARRGEKRRFRSNEIVACNILRPSTWPTKEQFGLDESQYHAVQLALSRALAIIQGPPGTGKTFIGWKIAQVLLENDERWQTCNPDSRTPILVVCYTNHALDQFLEGISSFLTTGIIRIGGQSKSKAVEPFLLKNIKKDGQGFVLPNDLRYRLSQAYSEKSEIESSIARLMKTLNLLEKSPLSFYALSQIGDRRDLLEQIVKASPTTKLSKDQMLNVWLKSVDRSSASMPFEFNDLRQMMTFTQFDQVPCMNALFMVGGNLQRAVPLMFQLAADPRLYIPFPALVNVPSIYFVDELTQYYGFGEEDVIFALQQHSNDFNAALNFLHGVAQVEPPAPQEAPAAVEGEAAADNDDQLFLEIDDENRQVLDDEDDLDRLNVDVQFVDDNLGFGFNEPVQNSWTDVGAGGGSVDQFKIPPKLLSVILNARPMADAEIRRVVDVWTLALPQRWSLYRRWLEKYRANINEKVNEQHQAYFRTSQRMAEIRSLEHRQLFKQAKVLGMTTSGAAKHQDILSTVKPKIVIIEEAAEVLESHVVTSLSSGCQHAILIGDHQQLRPSTAVYQLAKHFKLDVSLFERLISNKFDYAVLKQQHRMRPEIADSLMPYFYDGLINHESVQKFENVKGVGKNMFFFNHSSPEKQVVDSTSRQNDFEAKMIVGFCKYLLQQGYEPSQITVLCCYAGQMFNVKKMMKSSLVEAQSKGVRVTVVDNYQGEECEIILLSFVRSNDENKIGFLATKNRVCVALSRAKWGLYCFGNFNHLAACSRELWGEIVANLKERAFFGTALQVCCQVHGTPALIERCEDFQRLVPEGGCRKMCDYRLDCGHTCVRYCHPYDADHKQHRCVKPCERKCPENHPCKKRCFEDCGDCQVLVTKILPLCGHSNTRVPCHKSVDSIKCQAPCVTKLACGHLCQETCDPYVHTTKCKIKLVKTLPCGHSTLVPCHQSIDRFKCSQLVEKTWPLCGHTNKAECHVDVQRTPCQKPCKTLLDCEHECPGDCSRCFNGRVHARCEQACKRILVCGHECGDNCTRSCPPCSKPCENRCVHSKCQVKKRGKKPAEGRKCGLPCPVCREACQWVCAHHKCTKLCSEDCDRPRCFEKCAKTLKCGHACIGVCGERCPKVCAVCDTKKMAEIKDIFFGGEADEGVSFIELADCGHIFEMNGLDRYFDTCFEREDDGSINLLSCPRCKKLVLTTLRYGDAVKLRQRDVQKVKEKICGDLPAANQKRVELIETIDSYDTEMLDHDDGTVFMELRKYLANQPNNNDFLSGEKIVRAQNFLQFIVDVQEMRASIKAIFLLDPRARLNAGFGISTAPKKIVDQTVRAFVAKWFPTTLLVSGDMLDMAALLNVLQCELNALVDWEKASFKNASDQMMQEFSCELRRMKAYISVVDALKKMVERQMGCAVGQQAAEVEYALNRLMRRLYGSEKFDANLEKVTDDELMDLRDKMHLDSPLGITDKERKDILKAMNMQQGHWYKCKNGHVYCITECGGAMQEAKCPDCGSGIGGMSHQLLPDNAVATEMDGATQSAWDVAVRGLGPALDRLRMFD